MLIPLSELYTAYSNHIVEVKDDKDSKSQECPRENIVDRRVAEGFCGQVFLKHI